MWDDFDKGFIQVKDFMSSEWMSAIFGEMQSSSLEFDASGIRHIHKKLPSVFQYIASDEFTHHIQNHLTPQHKLVRSILFNKTPETNWYVSWHQDKTVSVSEKFSDPQWKNWSIKEGVLHIDSTAAHIACLQQKY